MTIRYVQKIHKHAPNDKRTYGLIFTDELNGDSILSATWTITPSTGLVKSNEQVDGDLCKLFLAGGVNFVDYLVTCTVTTDGGEIINRSILIECREL